MNHQVFVERAENAVDFARATNRFLSAREAENNLLLGITSDIEAGAAFGADPPYFAVVRRNREVTAVALRTPPFNVTISATVDLEAVDLIAEDLHRVYAELPGVLAPLAPVNRFADKWESLTSQRRRVRLAGRCARFAKRTAKQRSSGRSSSSLSPAIPIGAGTRRSGRASTAGSPQIGYVPVTDCIMYDFEYRDAAYIQETF